jgi:hypothetical protein
MIKSKKNHQSNNPLIQQSIGLQAMNPNKYWEVNTGT